MEYDKEAKIIDRIKYLKSVKDEVLGYQDRLQKLSYEMDCDYRTHIILNDIEEKLYNNRVALAEMRGE